MLQDPRFDELLGLLYGDVEAYERDELMPSEETLAKAKESLAFVRLLAYPVSPEWP